MRPHNGTFLEKQQHMTISLTCRNTLSVIDYINKCVDDVTVVKTVRRQPNHKPWLTGEVHSLLRTQDRAFKSGDAAAYSLARKTCHGVSKRPISCTHKNGTATSCVRKTRRLWQGFQNITDYKPPPPTICQNNHSLPEELNNFYARFEVKNTTQAKMFPLSSSDTVLQLSTAEVRKAFSTVNMHKAAGLDNIPGWFLKDCAEQLKGVFTDIFNTSLRQAFVPACLKTATITPIAKKPNPACPNDFRPVALTPIVTKCLERLVLMHIKNSLPKNLDPLQFTYKTNRFTEDAFSTTLHLTLSHLEKKNTYARVLFIDFSSAFNMIIPQQLVEKLRLLGVDIATCNWTLSFLTERQQTGLGR